MVKGRFSVEEDQARFLEDFRSYGFKDRSAMVRAAIDHFRRTLEQQRLAESAELYRREYEDDGELRDLTGMALEGWPE